MRIIRDQVHVKGQTNEEEASTQSQTSSKANACKEAKQGQEALTMADLSDAVSLLTSTIITQERLISARETEVNQLRGKLAEAEADLEIMKRALASFTEALALVTPVV